MRVVLAADISGTRDGKSWPPKGTEVDLPEAEAQDMIRSGTAYDLDDDRVASVKGQVFDKLELAGAPTGRESTDGQPDTNLHRAQAIGQGDQARPVARAAAEETGYTDEATAAVPGASPTVGDDTDNPTAASATDEKPEQVTPPVRTEGVTDVETASTPAVGTQTATRPSPRRR